MRFRANQQSIILTLEILHRRNLLDNFKKNILKNKDMSGATSFCLREKSPIANMVRKGLKKFGMGHERVKEAIENAGRQEVSKLEKGLSILATVAGVSPLLGFLGTVTGMIQAFMRI